jgi:23S rRNA pseudouridine2605 synthase
MSDKYKSRGERGDKKPNRSFDKKEDKSSESRGRGDSKPNQSFDKTDHKSSDSSERGERKPYRSFHKSDKKPVEAGKRGSTGHRKKGGPVPKLTDNIRLNKFIANQGVCSRREADTLITSGVITVNGKVITEMGYKVDPSDEVKMDGAILRPSNKQYLLLNKPKDFSLKESAVKRHKTVYQLVDKACKEMLVPVDKFDAEAMGLLLFTNDSDMIKRFNHPNHIMSQLLHINLDKPFQPEMLQEWATNGVVFNGKKMLFEDISFTKNRPLSELGIRMKIKNFKDLKDTFEAFGFKIISIDRLEYAGLSKKEIPRGQYRFLDKKEVSFLKMK